MSNANVDACGLIMQCCYSLRTYMHALYVATRETCECRDSRNAFATCRPLAAWTLPFDKVDFPFRSFVLNSDLTRNIAHTIAEMSGRRAGNRIRGPQSALTDFLAVSDGERVSGGPG